MCAQVSLPVYPMLNSTAARKGVRMGEALWAWDLRVRRKKKGGVVREKSGSGGDMG